MVSLLLERAVAFVDSADLLVESLKAAGVHLLDKQPLHGEADDGEVRLRADLRRELALFPLDLADDLRDERVPPQGIVSPAVVAARAEAPGVEETPAALSIGTADEVGALRLPVRATQLATVPAPDSDDEGEGVVAELLQLAVGAQRVDATARDGPARLPPALLGLGARRR